MSNRGGGLGVRGKRRGVGGRDTCICPKCGYETPHTRGVPCIEQNCPKCGTMLIGK
jgi:hypothetical protein